MERKEGGKEEGKFKVGEGKQDRRSNGRERKIEGRKMMRKYRIVPDRTEEKRRKGGTYMRRGEIKQFS